MFSLVKQLHPPMMLALCLISGLASAETVQPMTKDAKDIPQVYVDLTAADKDKPTTASAELPANAPALPPARVTADDAKNNSTDLGLMQQIRRSIVADATLSTAAQNINIIAQDGKVTLKGAVKSDSERQIILAKAGAVAGTPNVNNELTVSTPEPATNR